MTQLRVLGCILGLMKKSNVEKDAISEESTEDMSRKYDTRPPPIENALERRDAPSKEMRAGFAAIEKLSNKLTVRLDRIESEVKLTHFGVLRVACRFNVDNTTAARRWRRNPLRHREKS